MRDLLRSFADQGGTVLLSSHLLHEIEVVADDLVVIGRGRVVAQGTKDQLLHRAGTLVRTPAQDLPAQDTLAAALRATGATVTTVDRSTLRTDVLPEQVGAVALAARVPLTELRPADGAGLEEMFLQLTSDTDRDTDRDTATQGAAA